MYTAALSLLQGMAQAIVQLLSSHKRVLVSFKTDETEAIRLETKL